MVQTLKCVHCKIEYIKTEELIISAERHVICDKSTKLTL